MLKKDPIYFQKSKAAKQLELDYRYNLKSESSLRKRKKEFDRNYIKIHDMEKEYKRSSDLKYYKDPYQDRPTHKYGEDFNSDSDSSHDSEYKYGYNETEGSSASSGDKSISDKFYQEERKKNSEDFVYKRHRELNGSSSPRKQRSPNSIENQNKMFRNGKDYDVYISQQPITLRYESQSDLRELKTKNNPKSKEKKKFKTHSKESKPPGDYERNDKRMKNIQPNQVHYQQQQGDSSQMYSAMAASHLTNPQPHFNDIKVNLSTNTAQSLFRLLYLPVYVLNNEIAHSSGSVQPALFMNSTDVMSVYTTLNTGQSKVFEQKTKNMNIETKTSPTAEITNDHQNKKGMSNTNKQNDLELFASPLGTAMSAKSYGDLINSRLEPKHTLGSTLTSLIKASKTFKKKIKSTQQNATENFKSENEHKKTNSTTVNLNDRNKNININLSYSKVGNEQKKSGTKNTRMNTLLVGRKGNKNKDQLKEEGTNIPQTRVDVENIDDNQNIIINLTKNVSVSDSTEVKRSASKNVSNDYVENYNTDSSQKQHATDGKPSLVLNCCTKVPQDKIVAENNNRIEPSNNGITALQSSATPEKNESIVMDKKRNTCQKNSELYESNNKMGIDSIIMQSRAEWEKSGLRQDREEIVSVANKKICTKEISVDKINDISRTDNQQIKNKESPINLHGILKRRIFKTENQDKGKKDNQTSQLNSKIEKKNSNKSQEKSKSVDKQTSNLTKVTEEEPNKSLTLQYDKNQETDTIKKVSQCYQEMISEDSNIDNNIQIQPKNDTSAYEQQGDTHSKVSLEEKSPPIEVIYPPTEKISAVKSTSNAQYFELEKSDELLLEGPPTCLDKFEAIKISSFRTVQYILGATCYDKLLEVVNVFYCEEP